MAEISDLLTIDASNTARWPNGMPVPSINDSARALEGMIARDDKDRNGSLATTGTGSAYTLMTHRAVASYEPGLCVLVRAHIANTGAATLAINGLAAKPLVRQNGTDLVLGDILEHQPMLVVYNPGTDKFHCLGVTA